MGVYKVVKDHCLEGDQNLIIPLHILNIGDFSEKFSYKKCPLSCVYDLLKKQSFLTTSTHYCVFTW